MTCQRQQTYSSKDGKQTFGDESVWSLNIDLNYLYTDNPQLWEVKSERS